MEVSFGFYDPEPILGENSKEMGFKWGLEGSMGVISGPYPPRGLHYELFIEGPDGHWFPGHRVALIGKDTYALDDRSAVVFFCEHSWYLVDGSKLLPEAVNALQTALGCEPGATDW